MCADWHATNVRKGYDGAARVFHTTWSELGVGCEACHGPGSDHVASARSGRAPADGRYGLTSQLDERRGIRWNLDMARGVAARSAPRASDREIEVCARCHARRSQLTDRARAGDPLEDAFRPSLLDAALFYADGQQKDEDYTYASFLQSRMYAKGVTCSDCHDPHSGKTSVPGNALCTRCHLAAKYDVLSHHGHRGGSPAAECVNCHMPSARFMVVDDRHDHSFRIPRPDQSVSLGVPNACTSCHTAASASWAAAALQRRAPGRAIEGFQRFADAFALRGSSSREAADRLRRVAADPTQPAIVRASAVDRLGAGEALDAGTLAPFVTDPSPAVRRSALAALAHAEPAARLPLATPRLTDPIRTVRVQAAIALADVADTSLSGASRAAFDRAFQEFVDEQTFNGDRPESQTNLGQALAQRGRAGEAMAAFAEAVRLDPTFVPAYVNLADLYRAQGNEPAAEQRLREAVRAAPSSAVAHHALGLTLVRERRLDEALGELAAAARLDPSDARHACVYAVALHDAGQPADAVKVLEASIARHPTDALMLFAAADYLDQLGRPASARPYAQKLLALNPAEPGAQALAERLKIR